MQSWERERMLLAEIPTLTSENKVIFRIFFSVVCVSFIHCMWIESKQKKIWGEKKKMLHYKYHKYCLVHECQTTLSWQQDVNSSQFWHWGKHVAWVSQYDWKGREVFPWFFIIICASILPINTNLSFILSLMKSLHLRRLELAPNLLGWGPMTLPQSWPYALRLLYL